MSLENVTANKWSGFGLCPGVLLLLLWSRFMFLWAFDEREHQQQQQQQQQQIAKKKHVDDGHFKEQSSLGTLFPIVVTALLVTISYRTVSATKPSSNGN